MFGWLRIPKKVVDGRASVELAEQAAFADVKPGVVVVVGEDVAAKSGQRHLPDGRTITYEIPDDDADAG